VPARTVGRITSRAAFVDLQRSRCRGASGPVRATFVPADDKDPDAGVYPQVGYAIGRNCGGAVVRNRLRRRVREVVRHCAPELPRGRYLLRLEAAAADTPAAVLRVHVMQALQRAASTSTSASTASPTSTSTSTSATAVVSR
jgi:ribonuclease P protein component